METTRAAGGSGPHQKEATLNGTADPIDPKLLVEQGYDRVAHDYARLEGDAEWPRLRWLRKVLDQLPPGSPVLDLGCGSGDPADIEIAREHRVTGVDISRTQIDLARRNVPAGRFIHGDLGSVTFPLASFDAVVSFYALEHLPRLEHPAILRRIHGWLRDGGQFLLCIEAGEFEDGIGEWLGVPMFFSCYDPETTQSLIKKAGFTILETAIESQLEAGHEIPYLWVLAQKA